METIIIFNWITIIFKMHKMIKMHKMLKMLKIFKMLRMLTTTITKGNRTDKMLKIIINLSKLK